MLLSRVKLASDPGLPLLGGEGKRWRARGPCRIHPGVFLLLLGAACLGCGFMAGRKYAAQSGSQVASASQSGGSATAAWAGIGNKLLAAFSGSSQNVKARRTTFCSNTCAKANDGVCDDGRANMTADENGKFSPFFPACDLGTDCNDCGPWVTTTSPSWAVGKGEGPISLLKRKEVEVRVKPTSIKLFGQPNAFKFAYTDPKKDVDVSSHMELSGHVEMAISRVFYRILNNRCVRPDGSRSLFVDVGANFGWYSVLAAAMGCRVIAYEPVPHFRAFLEYNVHVNNLGHLVDIRGVVVSHESDKNMNMVVPSAGIWGTAGIDGLNIDRNIPGATETLSIPSVTLDREIKEDVLLMKVDVEGWEWSVMQGAKSFMSGYNVENVVMEYSPGVAERNFRRNESIATVQMLIDLVNGGYRIAHLLERTSVPEGIDQPLTPYEEVLMRNLKYDMHDVQLLKDNKLGCPMPEELRACGGAIPENLSPRSLRSTFSHNTNLWASKNPTLQPFDGHVGFIKLDDPADKYMITHKVYDELFGMGHRRCRDMDPRWQVRHRCACLNKAVCGTEEDLVLRLSREGKMSTNYVINN